MTNLGLIRKVGNVLSDPVLRRWLAGRVFKRWPGHSSFVASRPPYLDDLMPLSDEQATKNYTSFEPLRPQAPITIDLAGSSVTVRPGEEAKLFERTFDDTETLLALHRFAWMPVISAIDRHWVAAMWTAWRSRFGNTDEGWEWHPYTAAERAVNLLAFGRRHGLPEPYQTNLACLAGHGAAIARRLEYYGDHNTSNHLANNGRGLYILGLELGMPSATAIGLRIVLNEARRIFGLSGMLREGSSHYHLLYVRNYLECWLAAQRHGRPEAAELLGVAQRALAAATPLRLAGGLPLIGDISPDCAPDHLDCLTTGRIEGWIATLPPIERKSAIALHATAGSVDTKTLATDGWIHGAHGPWSALWHYAPDGWIQMPGHGHQDLGSAEIHYGDIALIRDPGRGRYGTATDDLIYTAGEMHNTLLVDGADPYPPNKPYYDSVFRRSVIARPPRRHRLDDGLTLEHDGFTRLGGIGTATRSWHFNGDLCAIEDRVEGQGRHTIERHFIVPHAVTVEDGIAIIDAGGKRFRLSGDVKCRASGMQVWQAYNRARPATRLTFRVTANLPWDGRIELHPL